MADPRLARPLWRGRTNVDAFTIAWIEHAEQIKREKWPQRPELHHDYAITQGGYQGSGGDPDSAGTHALGGGTDFGWCGHTECLLALRLAGGFAWWRKTLYRNGVLVWPNHIHGAPIGHPYMAPLLREQQVAYFNRRDGLAGNGPDDGPRLDPIPRPVWPWPPEDELNADDRKFISDQFKTTNARIDKLAAAEKRRNQADRERDQRLIKRTTGVEVSLEKIEKALAEEPE